MYNIMFDDYYLKEHLRSLRSLSGFNAFFLFEPTYRRQHKFKSRLHIQAAEMLALQKLLHRMTEDLRENIPGWDLLLLSKLLEIFVFISREYSKKQSPMARSLYHLGEVISLLENNYRQEWTIAKLSRVAAMAPSTLLPVFRKVTGYSPIDYLLHVRLSKAAEKLRFSRESISAVAMECGFPDSNYFSRQFRKKYLCSPRDYRKNNS